MVLTLGPELEATVERLARSRGVDPAQFALNILTQRLLVLGKVPEPRNEWERRLLAIGTDCGVSLSNEALSREQMYE